MTLNDQTDLTGNLFNLLFSTQNEDQVFLKDLRLIIVDSVASVISPNLGGHQCHGTCAIKSYQFCSLKFVCTCMFSLYAKCS